MRISLNVEYALDTHTHGAFTSKIRPFVNLHRQPILTLFAAIHIGQTASIFLTSYSRLTSYYLFDYLDDTCFAVVNQC